MTTPKPACPVCGATLRGSNTCSRCGADLTDYVATIAAAWRLRCQGWQALFAGDCVAAGAAAARSAALAASPSAERLRWLAAILQRAD